MLDYDESQTLALPGSSGHGTLAAMNSAKPQPGQTSPTPTDLELMQRVQHQDQSALMLLYERYGRQAYGLAYRVLRDFGLAEEVVQDTFLKVWHKGVQWDPAKGQLISWLLTVTRYTAIDRLRREQRGITQSALPLEDLVAPPSVSGTVGTASWQDGQVLRELLARLPAEQAQVVELAFFQGMTHRELAEQLGWPLGTVKTRLRLALQKLRVLWSEATAPPPSDRG